MKTASLFLTVVLSFPLLAAERPTPPAPGIDSVLLKGKTPRAFFAERAANGGCTGELAKARQRFESANGLLKEMVSKGKTGAEVDAQEEAATAAREEYLAKMEECGPCTTRPIEQREVPTAGRTEIWYLSDGSCQLSTTDAAKLQAAMAKATELLSKPLGYPGKRGGYTDILELILVDPTTGKNAESFGNPGEKHPHAFISVKGPELLGIVNAFSYYLENKTTKTDKEFTFTFATTRPARGFRFPDLVHVTAGGTKKKVNQTRLSNLFGMWYITSDGYFRYTTAADFGISLKYIEKLGRRVLADTLVQTVEKAGGIE